MKRSSAMRASRYGGETAAVERRWRRRWAATHQGRAVSFAGAAGKQGRGVLRPARHRRGDGAGDAHHQLPRRYAAHPGGAAAHVPSGGFTDSDLRTVFDISKGLRRSGGPSTYSLPGILGNVQNKVALAAFQATMATWMKFCKTRPAKDFKARGIVPAARGRATVGSRGRRSKSNTPISPNRRSAIR